MNRIIEIIKFQTLTYACAAMYSNESKLSLMIKELDEETFDEEWKLKKVKLFFFFILS